MPIVAVTNENYKKVVEENNEKILLEFWSSHCGPCRMFATTLESLSNDTADFLIGKINIDEEKQLSEKFNISSVPTLVLMEKGKEMKRASGVASKQAILQMVNGDT